MLRLPRHAMQQQRAARGRFRVPVGNRQPRIKAPPVVDQTVDPRQNLAALEVMGGEAGPPPLIFQLIEKGSLLRRDSDTVARCSRLLRKAR